MAKADVKAAVRFKPKKPYGIVVGHPLIRFEQDGVSFGADGLPVSAQRDEEPTPETDE